MRNPNGSTVTELKPPSGCPVDNPRIRGPLKPIESAWEGLARRDKGGKSPLQKCPFYRGFWGVSFDKTPFRDPDIAEPFRWLRSPEEARSSLWALGAIRQTTGSQAAEQMR